MHKIEYQLKTSSLHSISIFALLLLVSCSGGEKRGGDTDINSTPRQVIENMYALKSENGNMQMRMSTPRMERYQNDSTRVSYELFPQGLDLYGYNEEGELETRIRSDQARHTTTVGGEKWEAFGNVFIHNFINEQVMETDTLYWDRENHKIYTHCYVKMKSPQGFMQGYGMESDEMARNARLLKLFDCYGVISDSNDVRLIDTANFIGPRSAVKRMNPLKIHKEQESDSVASHRARLDRRKGIKPNRTKTEDIIIFEE